MTSYREDPLASAGNRDLASVGALVADRARCRILLALADGMALSSGRLAAEAGVGAPTASSHLQKLVAGGLLVAENVGRRRVYRLAGPEVANLLEALERLAPTVAIHSFRQSEQSRAWRQARVCYDHLAGRLGTDLMQAIVEHGYVDLAVPPIFTGAGDPPAITTRGRAFLETVGVVVPPGGQPVRHHLDSTEGAPHFSGMLGRALLARFLALEWLRREKNQRLRVTQEGMDCFGKQFGIYLGQ